MSTYYVNEGETSSGLVISGYDTVIVSGGTAVDTTINGGGMSICLRDGAAINTVMSGGVLQASAGRVENITLDGGAAISVQYSVAVTGATVNSGSVEARGTLNDTAVNSGGSVNVYGGTVNNLTVYTLGRAYFANTSTTVNNLVVAGSPNTYTVASAGYGVTLNGATVAGGYLSATNSAALNDVALSDSGTLILSGGETKANRVQINSGGSMTMNANASAAEVTVNQGGWFSAGFGYYGSYTIYEEDGLSSIGGAVKENGGAVYLGSTTVVRYDSTIGEYGDYIYSSGVVYPVEILANSFGGLVYSDGKQGTVHSGTTATDITATRGGLIVYDGGIVAGYTVTPHTYVSNFINWSYGSAYNEETGDYDYFSSSYPDSATVTDLGNLTVVAGGTVTGLVAQAKEDAVDDYWNEPYLNFQIAPGTVISGTVDGVAFATERGILQDASLKNAGLTYMACACASRVTQTNGKATFMADANAYDLNFSGTYVTFSSGAHAIGVSTSPVSYRYTEYSMGWDDENEPEEKVVEATSGASVTVSAGADVTGLDMDSQSYLRVQVAKNTVLQGTSGGVAVNVSGGVFADASLGSTYVEVLGATVYDDGVIYYTGGAGTVSNLTVNPGAVVSAADEEGVAVLNMVENGGAVWLGWGEKPENITSYSFASNTFSYEHLGGNEECCVTVHKNTIARDNILFGGELQVFSGGVVSNFYTVGSGMNTNHATFYSGAIVSNFDTVRYSDPGKYHPGNFDFNEGVQVNVARLTDFDGITLFINPETVITNGSIDDVPFSVEGGVLSGFKGGDTGWFSDTIGIYRGARMIDCRTDQWANVNIWQGAYGSNNTFADGYVYVGSRSYEDESEEGGIALLEKTTLGVAGSSNKGTSLYIQDGGVVRDITVNRGSEIQVGSGGKLTGKIRKDSTEVSVNYGGVIDFDITAQDALAEARVDSLWNVTNDGRYSITIDGTNQAAGTYVLADATYFDNVFFYNDNAAIYFDLMDVSGSTFGYFYAAQENQYHYDEATGDEWYESFVGFNYVATSTDQPDFKFSLDEGKRYVGDGGYFTTLTFTVDSGTVAPGYVVAPTVTADVATFTNSDVVLTADFSEDVVTKEYSLDGQTWQALTVTVPQDGTGTSVTVVNDDGSVTTITGGDGTAAAVPSATLTVTENGTYYFRGADAAGNVSDVTTFRVSNIDKVAPTAPTDLDAAETEDGVKLSWAESSDDYSGIRAYIVTYKESGSDQAITVKTPYKFLEIKNPVPDGTTSATATGGTASAPEYEWSVQAVDYAGNVSEATEFSSGIPGPVASASITTPTNGAVNVVIGTMNPDVAQYEYSLDDQKTWNRYDLAGVVVSENITVWFRGITVNGEYTKSTFIKVDNIDLVAPDAPAPFASTNELTNQNVYVFATFSEDSVKQEVSLDGVSWSDYSPNGVPVSENGMVYFRAADAAGNISDVAIYEVTNIDKVPPAAPTVALSAADTFEGLLVSGVFSDDSVVKEYSLDGKTWEAYTEAIPVREVGTVIFFRAADAAGNVSEVTEYTANSLVPGPAAPTAAADVTAPTNGSVTVTATFGEDSVTKEYSYDGRTWFAYTEPLVATENVRILFRGTNADGYASNETVFEVTNIDKVAPEAPAVPRFPAPPAPTNQDVTVTATFSDDSVVKQYSLDGVTWADYPENGVVMSENGMVYFRGADAAGNVSDVAIYEVSNIDKTAPDAPVITADITAPTRNWVVLTAAFGEDSAVQEYSFDGENWQEYRGSVWCENNGTVYFRGADAAGNISTIASYEVSNIDRESPMLPTVEQDITGLTNQPVTVTAYFSDDTAEKWVSINGGDWKAYTGPVVFHENGKASFRAVDAAGNYTQEVVHQVSNIDIIPPEAPRVSADVTEDTDGIVIVTAAFGNDSAVRQYSLDGETWQDYTDPVRFEKNGMVWFRAIDEAGNISETSYAVDNIYEPVDQESYADDGWNDWGIDKVTGALNEELNDVYLASAYEFKDEILLDKKHSVDVDGWHNFVGKDEAGNVDASDYVRLHVDESMRLCFTVTANANASCFLVALIQNEDKYGRTVLSIRNLMYKSLKKDKDTGLYTFSGNIQLQEEMYDNTKYFLAIAPSSKKKGVFYNVEYDRYRTEYYRFCNNDDDGGPAEGEYNEVYMDKDLYVDGWVGFGDTVDYYKFTLDHAAKLSFGVTAGTYLSFDLYEPSVKNGKQTLKKKGKTLSLKSELVEMPESGATEYVTLDPGEYYFSVKSTNVQKCGEEEINYIIRLMPGSVFYGDGDDGWNNWVARSVSKKEYELNAEITEAEDIPLDEIDRELHLDREGAVEKNYTSYDSSGIEMDDVYVNYVGIGDLIDYKKVSLDVAANLCFSVHASDAAMLKIYRLEQNKLGAYSLKSLQSTKAKYDKTAGEYQAKTKRLLLDAGDYYISMQTSKKAEAYYNVFVYDNEDDRDHSTVFFREAVGGGVDDWADMATKGAASDKIGEIVELSQNHLWVGDGWVGYGDPIDYSGFTIDGPAKLVFDVAASDKAKFTVYSLEEKKPGKYSLKTVMAVSLKENKNAEYADEKYTAETKALLLTTPGTYYVSVQSPNAASGGNAYYSIVVDGDKSGFFDEVKQDDSGNDNWKTINASEEKKHVITQTGTMLEGWVGYGDVVDYYGFSLENNTNVVFTVTATDEASFTLSAYTERRGKTSLKAVQKKTALKYNSATGLYEFSMKRTMLSKDTLYYITMESTNAKKGGSADYTVSVDTFQPSLSSALTMPEEASSDVLQDSLFAGQTADVLADVSVANVLDDEAAKRLGAELSFLA